MVAERRNFQRVYDLRSRVMPDWQDALHSISVAEATRLMLLNSARSLGIFRGSWLADYYRLKRVPLSTFLAEAQEAGDLIAVTADGLGDMWLHRDLLPMLENPLQATHSALLSPFDPVVWDRKRALELFSFDYRIECYTPAAKRKFGYFVLPMLHRGEIKGRLDARMLRQSKQLEIKNIWLEPQTRVTLRFVQDIRRAIERFAAWQGAETVSLLQAPASLRQHWPAQWSLNREAGSP